MSKENKSFVKFDGGQGGGNVNFNSQLVSKNIAERGFSSFGVVETSSPFKATFRTTSGGETITLPYEVAGTYSGTIDWGDGGATSVNSYANRTHTYAISGDYIITITGVTTGFRFNNTGDRLKIRSIQNWGNLKLGNSGNYFEGCINLTLTSVIGVLDLTGTTSLQGAFKDCSSLTTINNINSWDTSAIEDMSIMFLACTSFNQGLSFDTSEVRNMRFMFTACSVFNSELDFNTKEVTDMQSMFQSCVTFNQPLDFNTSAVDNMESMFAKSNAFDQNIGTWNVESVTNFTNFMGTKTPATFSTTNLDNIYNNWSLQAVQIGIVISFGSAKYSASGVAGRFVLTDRPYEWNITDGGL
jgi:surface protein